MIKLNLNSVQLTFTIDFWITNKADITSILSFNHTYNLDSTLPIQYYNIVSGNNNIIIKATKIDLQFILSLEKHSFKYFKKASIQIPKFKTMIFIDKFNSHKFSRSLTLISIPIVNKEWIEIWNKNHLLQIVQLTKTPQLIDLQQFINSNPNLEDLSIQIINDSQILTGWQFI